jgi:hypothetical protein
MTRGTSLLAVTVLALALAACGSESKQARTPPPKQTATPGRQAQRERPSARDVAIIRGWSRALRHGDARRAARYFGLPAIVSNGSPTYRLTRRSQVVLWNRTLACGARYLRAVDTGAYVVATFELTERPGRGKCGPGVGAEASTAFLIRRGKIIQWRRVLDPGPVSPTGPAS